MYDWIRFSKYVLKGCDSNGLFIRCFDVESDYDMFVEL